ncbi:RIP metalloprotease RseP [bacterium]|nr:RIP metalloprotease RseP [bacterium]
MFTTIIIFLVVLSLLVFVHEWGHFVMARKFGVKAEEFGFGFPPRVLGIYKNKNNKWKIVRGSKKVEDAQDTIYSVNLIPLGGFVKIKGEDGDSGEDEDSFVHKKIWKRVFILSAGVSMNIVLAMVLLSIGLMLGLPHAAGGDFGSKAKVSDESITITYVAPETPALESGIKMGDVLLSINNQKFNLIEEVEGFTETKEGVKFNYEIKRGKEVFNLEITPENIGGEEKKIGVGIGISETVKVSYPWYLAIWKGIKQTFFLLGAIIIAFFGLIKGLVMGQGVGGEVGGPIKIAELIGQFADLGIAQLLQFTALISVNLAVINFLPIPALDGGRVMFLIIEKIKGSPVKKEIEAVAHNIAFILLIILMIVVTFNEIVSLL